MDRRLDELCQHALLAVHIFRVSIDSYTQRASFPNDQIYEPTLNIDVVPWSAKQCKAMTFGW